MSGRITPTFLELEPPLAVLPPPELELEQAASRNAAADTAAMAASERLRIDPILSWRLSLGEGPSPSGGTLGTIEGRTYVAGHNLLRW